MRPPERLLASLVVCLLAVALPVRAGGKAEAKRQIEEARHLIDAKDYQPALLILAQVRSRDPDLRDETDRLIGRIIAARKVYNLKYQELLRVLQEELDVEKGLALIEELKELDPKPDAAIQKSVRAANLALQETRDFNRFTAVMDAAAKQLDVGAPAEALRTYLTGFDIVTKDYAGYDPTVLASALGLVAELAKRARAAAEADLARPVADLDRLLESAVSASGRAAFEGSALATMRSLAEAEAQIVNVVGEIGSTAQRLAAARSAELENLPLDYYLNLLVLMSNGREGRTEGIVRAAHLLWTETDHALALKASEAATTTFGSAEGLYASTADRLAFSNALSDAEQRGLLAVSLIELLPPDAAAGTRFAELRERTVVHREQMAETRDYLLLYDLSREFEAVDPAAAASGALREGRTRLAAVLEGVREGARAAGQRADALDGAQGALAASQAEAARTMGGRFTALETRSLERDAQLAVRLATLDASAFEPRFAEAASLVSQGERRAASDAQQPSTQALELYRQGRDALASLVASLDGHRDAWSAEPAHVTSSAGFLSLFATLDDLRQRIAALDVRAQSLQAAAEAGGFEPALAAAIGLRRQGEQRVASAVQQPSREGIALYQQAQDALVSLAAEMDAHRDRWQSASSAVQSTAGFVSLFTALEELRGRMATLIDELAGLQASAEAGGFAPRYREAVAARDRGRTLVTGDPKQPREGIAIYEQTRADLLRLVADLDLHRDRWTPSRTVPAVAALLDGDLTNLRSQLATLDGELAALAGEAAARRARAATLREEGSQAYDRGTAATRTAKKAEEFDAAIDFFTAALNAYDASLALEEDALARRRLTEVPQLSAAASTSALAKRREEVLILVDEGVQLYQDDRFEEAKTKLEAAQQMYKRIDPKNPDGTTEYYLKIVNSALTVSGKREVAQTDPLYQDIAGLMFQAYDAFLRAEKLARPGASLPKEAEDALADVVTSVGTVKKLVANYAPASMLEFRVQRLRQGDAEFVSSLRGQVEEFRRIATSGTLAAKAEAFRKLQDIQAFLKEAADLQPTIQRQRLASDLGVAAILKTLAVALNYKQPISDQAKLDSTNRYNSALTAYRRRDYDAALQLISEALSLNPENTRARTLQNQVLNDQRSVATRPLDADAQKVWSDAVRLLTNRDPDTARLIVDQLYERKRDYRTHPLFIDLDAKITMARQS